MSHDSATNTLPGSTKPINLVIDVLIVLAVSGIAFVLEGLVSARGWITVGADLRGLSAILAGALTAVIVVIHRGGTLADLGFRRPEKWSVVPLQVGAILAVFILAQAALPLLVSLIVPVQEPDLSRYDTISGNLGAAIAMALILPLTASIPEEIIFRGFFVGRLSELFAHTAGGATLAVVVQALVFGSIHYQWGIGGIIMTFIMGIVWGAAFLMCGRNLWTVIFAHSAGHILLVSLLYFG